jgi:hypothetical protein
MVTLIVTSNFRPQETRLRKLDALVGTKVSVKNVSVQTELKGDKGITVQSLSKLLTSC